MNAAPHTLEGYAVLHQFFRIKRDRLSSEPSGAIAAMTAEAGATIAALGKREDGDSAIFTQLGHKGDLIAIHFRRSLDELETAQRTMANLALSEFLEQSSSYLSIVEIGLYEATAKLHRELAERGVEPHSAEWRAAVDIELAAQRAKLGARLW